MVKTGQLKNGLFWVGSKWVGVRIGSGQNRFGSERVSGRNGFRVWLVKNIFFKEIVHQGAILSGLKWYCSKRFASKRFASKRYASKRFASKRYESKRYVSKLPVNSAPSYKRNLEILDH
ncbi:hypothetical protein Hanom_Chr10g00883711 [Helianthus anomalus]